MSCYQISCKPTPSWQCQPLLLPAAPSIQCHTRPPCVPALFVSATHNPPCVPARSEKFNVNYFSLPAAPPLIEY